MTVWIEPLLLKGVDRSDNEQFLNNKIQYAIRYVQFVKLSFLVSIVILGSVIFAKRSSLRRDKLYLHEYNYFSHVSIYLSECEIIMP